MKLEAKYTFNAPQDRVWALLQDPQVLSECIPGCDRLEPAGEDQYEAVLKIGLAAVRGTYKGKVAITDKRPPAGYRLLVEGSGTPGFVKGEGAITLVDRGGVTDVAVLGEAQVGGPIAGVGQRMLSPVAKMLMDQFFGQLQKKAEGA